MVNNGRFWACELCCHGNLKQNQENFIQHLQVTKKWMAGLSLIVGPLGHVEWYTKCLSHVVFIPTN